jgi:hypothetical protein
MQLLPDFIGCLSQISHCSNKLFHCTAADVFADTEKAIQAAFNERIETFPEELAYQKDRFRICLSKLHDLREV